MKKVSKFFAVALVVLMAFTIQIPVSAATNKASTTQGVYAKLGFLSTKYAQVDCYDTLTEEFEVQLRDYRGKEVDLQREMVGMTFSVQKNKLYSFRVRGVKAEYNYDDDVKYVPYTPWSNSVYFTTAKYKVAQSGKSKKIKVSVPKVAGISNYKVYMSMKANSGWKKVKTLSSGKSTTVTKFNKKALKAKKTYYFKFVPNKDTVVAKEYEDGITNVQKCRLK